MRRQPSHSILRLSPTRTPQYLATPLVNTLSWRKDHESHQWAVENLPARRPYDGQTLVESFETVIPRLRELFAKGYRAPNDLVERIEERIAEGITD